MRIVRAWAFEDRDVTPYFRGGRANIRGCRFRKIAETRWEGLGRDCAEIFLDYT